MRRRIPIGKGSSEEDRMTRRSALTRLARIAKACSAIAVFGLAPEITYASGNLGNWDPGNKTVYFDGARPC
jgi:hypothetical protein